LNRTINRNSKICKRRYRKSIISHENSSVLEKNNTFAAEIINNEGVINYDELERTADAIERGIAYIDRLSLAEERGRTKGNRRNVEASVLLGRAYSSQQSIISAKSGESRTEIENAARIEQEHLLETWAKERGIFEEWSVATSRTLYSSIGTESKVYVGSTQDTVIKITMPYLFDNTPLSFL
jgi:hypothetical protein